MLASWRPLKKHLDPNSEVHSCQLDPFVILRTFGVLINKLVGSAPCCQGSSSVVHHRIPHAVQNGSCPGQHFLLPIPPIIRHPKTSPLTRAFRSFDRSAHVMPRCCRCAGRTRCRRPQAPLRPRLPAARSWACAAAFEDRIHYPETPKREAPNKQGLIYLYIYMLLQFLKSDGYVELKTGLLVLRGLGLEEAV